MQRRGFTLIEMIATMTAATVLMGIAVCLLSVLIRAQDAGREHLERDNSLVLLAERFRRDVHAAVTAPSKILDRADTWDLPLSADGFSHYVNYEYREGFINRTEQKSGQPTRRETYALPEDCAVSITADGTGETTGGRPLVSLAITPKSGHGREIRIEAALGWDHRFARRAEGGE